MARSERKMTNVFEQIKASEASVEAPEKIEVEGPGEVINEAEAAPGGSEEILTVSAVKESLLNEYQEKTKKQTMEDTHKRSTFLFRRDLEKRLDKLAKNKRGFKTMFINSAIEALLDEMEKK